MAVSDFVLDIANLIKEKSGVDFNIADESSKATEEWIPIDQLCRIKNIQLRTAEQTWSKEGAKLKQFNPSCFLKEPGDVRCRVPGCSATSAPGATQSYEKMKQDLFLCEAHHRELTNLVSKRCAEANVTVNVANYKDEDFNGYTSLIKILERAFTNLKTKSYQPDSTTTDSVVLAEVFLNTRNFLTITNALLNPGKENEKTAVGSILGLLQQILALPPNSLCILAGLLMEVMYTVFSFFGIVFTWVVLQEHGAKFGAGLGLATAFAVAVLGALSPRMTLAFSVAGIISGYLIGGGVYGFTQSPEILRLHQGKILKQQKIAFEHIENRLARMASAVFYVKCKDDGELSIEAKKNEDYWFCSECKTK